jgi:hypothetical protein
MSGVSRRPLSAIQIIRALTAAAPAAASSVSSGQSAQRLKDKSNSSEAGLGVSVERATPNSSLNIFGNLDLTHFDQFLTSLIAAAALAGAPERCERLMLCIFKWKEKRLSH